MEDGQVTVTRKDSHHNWALDLQFKCEKCTGMHLTSAPVEWQLDPAGASGRSNKASVTESAHACSYN